MATVSQRQKAIIGKTEVWDIYAIAFLGTNCTAKLFIWLNIAKR